ncbi:MAG: insulinase family protein [Gemmatimonadaceae bacterium]
MGALVIASRTRAAHGRVASARAHGVQGHGAPYGAPDRPGPRNVRRVPRRIHGAREHTSFQARVLDEHLEQAADVAGAFLLFAPALRDGDLQLERRVVLEEISMVEDTPDDLAFELHNAAMGRASVRLLDPWERATCRHDAHRGAARYVRRRLPAATHLLVSCAGRVDHAMLPDVLAKTG